MHTLVYTMGDDADDILSSFNLSEEDRKKYETVRGKFESYFVKKKNVIFERAKFNRRKQEESETVDDFIHDLYLNESVCRERHLLPAVEQTLTQLAGAQVFTKLDANSGFWQIPLANESVLLTTFITPFGRFCFNHLPFGITSAPEHFQRHMTELFTDIDGIVCLMDDILVHGRSSEEHNKQPTTVLQRLEKAGLTLNERKCEFSKNRVKFLGQIVDHTGV